MSFRQAVLLTLLAALGYLWYTGELAFMVERIEGLGASYGSASKRGL